MSLEAIRSRIASACRRAGRDPGSVRLLGVAKTFPAARVAELVAKGLTDVGENYVQEARAKAPDVPSCTWHMIGPLQRNKVNQALQLFDWIHTVDRPELVRALDERLQRPLTALLQVRLGDEESKHGLDPAAVLPMLEGLAAEPPRRLKLSGLMTIPAQDDTRGYYRFLRGLLEEIRARGFPFWDGAELSMGMSDDFEVAIEEGATVVRVGRALFGHR